jgi:uncharacterized protein YigE (DUF2233 family)
MSRIRLLAVMPLIALTTGSSAIAHGAEPEKREIDGVTYRIAVAGADSVRVIWQGVDKLPLRTFPALEKHLEGEKLVATLAMNGGIFEPGGIPSGLLVQNGTELRPVNRSKGDGNFYLEPNGIFLIGDKGAAIIATSEYPGIHRKPRHAVQSGPLLLRNDRIHPAFNASSANRLHRNGIGVRPDGKVILAITDFHSPKFPNLHEFACLFRMLGCRDALFLDGDLSQMRNGNELNKPGNRLGSFIVVVSSGVEKPLTPPAPP